MRNSENNNKENVEMREGERDRKERKTKREVIQFIEKLQENEIENWKMRDKCKK